MLVLSSVAFVLLITLFPLIGSLIMMFEDAYKDHLMKDNLQIIKENFALLTPLLMVSVLISPLFGWVCYKFKKKRLLYLFIIGIVGCWLVIISELLIQSNGIDLNDMYSFLFLSVWGIVAYSFFSFPILVPAMILLEKWTREK